MFTQTTAKERKNTDNIASRPRWPPISINTNLARNTTKNNNCFLPHQVFVQSRQQFPRAHHFVVPISSRTSMIRSFCHQGTIQYGGVHPFLSPKISSIHFSELKKNTNEKRKISYAYSWAHDMVVYGTAVLIGRIENTRHF
jgi:hypothetical protein